MNRIVCNSYGYLPFNQAPLIMIYFGYHEAKTLIPKYGDHFLYFKRYIDDIFLIWLVDDSSAWDDFQADLNNFGILKWEVNALGKSVDFLDLTLSLSAISWNHAPSRKR